MRGRSWHSVPVGKALLRGPLPVIALVGVHVALGLGAVRQKSATFDEGLHITGGLSCWAANDYRLHPENGNWTQRLAALPVLLGGFHRPQFDGPTWQQADVRAIDEHFFYELGNDADSILAHARLAIALPSAILAVIVYLWSRQLFGAYGGLVSLTLYAFSPSMLANGFLATSDVCVTLFFTAATWAQWNLMHRVTPLRVAAACVAIAGLLLSKFSGGLIVPVMTALAMIRLLIPEPMHVAMRGDFAIRGRLSQMAVLGGLVIIEAFVVTLVIWASYGFRYSAFAHGHEHGANFEVSWGGVNLGAEYPLLNHAIGFARDHEMLPEAYLYGFANTLHFSHARKSFLAGEISTTGWASFFPYSVALKTPLELLVLFGLAAWACWSHRGESAQQARGSPHRQTHSLFVLAPLLALLAVYGYFAVRSRLNIGHRHILPTYPAMFILAGAAAKWFGALPDGDGTSAGAQRSKRTLAAQGLVVTMLVGYVLEALCIWPDYLAYFNVLAGGPRHGYRWFVDSSIDWGQDLKPLARWLDDHPDDARDPGRVYLSYFGVARPDYYGIRANLLPSQGISPPSHRTGALTGGLYCVSATMLEQVYVRRPGRWNEDYELAYQQLRHDIEQFESGQTHQGESAQAAPLDMRQAYEMYEELRWARLCSFLRSREPDDNVGYSILIYRLTDEDVALALDGRPAELLDLP